MLNNGNDCIPTASHVCKVDLEEQLQHARKRKEKTEQDIAAFWGFDDYYEADAAATTLLGAMHAALKAAEANEQRCLDEIDADGS